jgi:hypothetical protein
VGQGIGERVVMRILNKASVMLELTDLGFAPDRLARLDRFLDDKYIAPGKLPCALTLVARHGDVGHDVERDAGQHEMAAGRRGHDAVAHDVLLCINTHTVRSEAKRMKMDSDQLFVRSPDQMYDAFPGLDDAVARSQEIAAGVDIDLDLNPDKLADHGYADLVVVTQKPTLANANPTISIHWGSGSGLQFGGQKQLQSNGRDATHAVDSLIALDSNGDGVDELALYGNGLAQFWSIRQSDTLGWGLQMLGLRRGADPFGKSIKFLPIETGPNGTPTALSSGDMNGDGFADLLIDHGGNKIDVLTGNRKAYLGPASVSFTREQTSPASDIQRTQLARFVGDVNADGRDDILFSPTSASPRTTTKNNPNLYESFKRGPYSYIYTGSKATGNNSLQVSVPKFWDQEDNNNSIGIANRVSGWDRYGFAIESLPGEATPYRTGSIGDVNGDGLEEVMFSSNQLYVGDQAPPAEQRPHTVAIYGSNRSSSEAPKTTTSNDGTDFDGAPLFAYGDAVTIRRDGVTWFHGRSNLIPGLGRFDLCGQFGFGCVDGVGHGVQSKS